MSVFSRIATVFRPTEKFTSRNISAAWMTAQLSQLREAYINSGGQSNPTIVFHVDDMAGFMVQLDVGFFNPSSPYAIETTTDREKKVFGKKLKSVIKESRSNPKAKSSLYYQVEFVYQTNIFSNFTSTFIGITQEETVDLAMDWWNSPDGQTKVGKLCEEYRRAMDEARRSGAFS
jgi:hypothetical protein